MAKYKVVSSCAMVQGGRAWQVGDEVELTDAQATDLGGVVAPVAAVEGLTKTVLTGIKRTVRKLDESEPEGDGE